MSLLNNNFTNFDGSSVTGRVPTQMLVYADEGYQMPEALRGAVTHAYKQFCDANRVSLAKFQVQHREFPDGSKISMESNNGVDRVMVWPVGGGKLYFCPNYLSGIVVKGWNAYKPSDTGTVEEMLSFYPSENYKPRLPRAWSYPKYESVAESDMVAYFYKFAKPIFGPFLFSTPPSPWTTYNSTPTQVTCIRPSMYSGTMRAVVQYMLGAEQKVKFDYSFQCTHGIAHVTNAKGVKIPWVIEISAANGVLAARLELCQQKRDKYNQLGYTPLGSLLPEFDRGKLAAMIKSGKVIELLPASALASFYSKLPFFPECGWAFSYTGLEAQNTCWDWPDDFKRSYRYKLTFSASASEPISASLSLEYEGYMIGSSGGAIQIYAISQVRVPNYETVIVDTFDMNPNGFYRLPVDSLCPIYVYYDNDAPKYVNWHNEMFRDAEPPDLPPYISFDPSTPGGFGQEYLIGVIQNGVAAKNHQIESPIHSPEVWKKDAIYTTATPDLVSPWKGFFRVVQEFGRADNEAYLITNWKVQTKYYIGAGESARHTVTIPLFEREMIYHMRSHYKFDTPEHYVSEPKVHHHYDDNKALYYFGPLNAIDNPARRWNLVGNAIPGVLYTGGTSVGLAIPAKLFRSDFTGANAYAPWVSVPTSTYYNGVWDGPHPALKTSLKACASYAPTFDFGFDPGAKFDADDWLKVSGLTATFASHIKAVRSTDGLYIVSRREYEMNDAVDFQKELGTYPELTDDNVVNFLAFVGSSGDKPRDIAPKLIPPSYPDLFHPS